jgi:trimethylamine-N-oxide reductase (cytochrome c)
MRKERPAYPQYIVGGTGWTHDESLEGERCKDYPLLLVSNHPRWRFHSECDDITWIREIPTCKTKGPDGYMYEPLWIHPTTAEERGITNGDLVKIFNERGTVLGAAYVTERMKPGAVSMDHGPKIDLITDGVDRGGSDNLISPSMGISKNVWGMASSGFLVEVEKLDPAEMENWRKEYPEAFARPYDPSYGSKLSTWVEGVI